MRLVLLHALPLDGRQWTGQMDILPGETIAPTLYSLGKTMSDWASGVLDIAGEGPLIVVGNSVGGSCALEMARQAPSRIAALVLVGTKPGHRPEPEFKDRFISALESDRPATVRNWVNGLLGPTTDHEISRRALAIAEAQSMADLKNGVQVFHTRPDAEDVACKWTKPLFVIVGEHDHTCVGFNGLQAQGTMALQTTRSTPPMQKVPNSGHYVNLEQPHLFNVMLSEIVNSCLAESCA